MGRVAVVLCLLFGVLTACTSGGHGHDDHLTIGAGAAVVHVPAKHGRVGVIVLHSLSHTTNDLVGQGWSTTSDHHGFIAVYPDRGGSWDAGLCCGSAALSKRDDVSWLSTVISTVRTKYKLTTIYLAGDSNGGMMVERLLAERPTTSSRFAVWNAAPEMPTAGRWTGRGDTYDGNGDATVPVKGGWVRIDGTAIFIRPQQSTSQWLVGSHLKAVVLPGYGHAPPSDWPETAWRALSS